MRFWSGRTGMPGWRGGFQRLSRGLPAILIVLFHPALSAALTLDWEETFIPNPPYPMEMHESDVRAGIMNGGRTQETGGLFWVDDDTLFFHGFDSPRPQTPEELHAQQGHFYVWTIGGSADPVNLYSTWYENITEVWICAFDGEVFFADIVIDYDEDGSAVPREIGANYPIRRGPPDRIGYEDRVNRPLSEILGNQQHSGQLTDCITDRRPDLADYRWYGLLDHHGVLINGPNDYTRRGYFPWILINDQFPEGWELPDWFMARPGNPSSTIGHVNRVYKNFHYLPFDNSYQVFASLAEINDWQGDYLKSVVQVVEENCQPVFYVYPEVPEAVRRCIPLGPWSGLIADLDNSQAGLVVGHGGGVNDRFYGLYLVRDDAVYQIDRGIVRQVRVSPNGCRVAYYHVHHRHDLWLPIRGFELNDGRSWRIRVLDLC